MFITYSSFLLSFPRTRESNPSLNICANISIIKLKRDRDKISYEMRCQFLATSFQPGLFSRYCHSSLRWNLPVSFNHGFLFLIFNLELVSYLLGYWYYLILVVLIFLATHIILCTTVTVLKTAINPIAPTKI